MFRVASRVLVCAALTVACGGHQQIPEEPVQRAEPIEGTGSETSSGVVNEQDAPEISRSKGNKGGIVVLWPRIVLPRGQSSDAETLQIARSIQSKMADLARSITDDVDVRPEPERVCPRGGCDAASFGALLARAGGGCAVVAVVSAPGVSGASLVRWSAGVIDLDANGVGFREPPEKVVRIPDYARCTDLPASLDAKNGDVEQVLRKLKGD